MMRLRLSMLILCSLYIFNPVGDAQERTLKNAINEEQVDDLTDELDYTKTKSIYVPREFKQKDKTSDKKRNSGGLLASILYYLIIIAVIIVAIFILIFTLSNIENSRSFDESIDVTIEEEKIVDIHEIDLEAMLSTALSANDFRMALRAQFLMLLRTMSSNKYIQWSKEKTNREYSKEVYAQPFYPNFQYTANLFDRTWYGDIDIDQFLYQQATPIFDDLKAYLNANPMVR